ncbi:hypothetical protein [Ilumatobacter sp.]|uniref:hypothetical protein n=1 Tax=Ilumatobacter sp. TaxID=1967498 RepID=UPI003C49B20D
MSDDLTGWTHDSNDDDSDIGGDGDPIYADSVAGPDGSRVTIDQLAERTVGTVLGLVRRANALAGGVLMVAGVIIVGSFLLGIAALDGGAQTFWIIFGGAGVVVGVGGVLLSMWRLHLVRRGSNLLVNEVRTLMLDDRNSERTVIETVEVTEQSVDVNVVRVSRQFAGLRDVAQRGTTTYPQLLLAMRAITTFPLWMLLATFTALAFIPMALIFVLILLF